MKKIKQKISKKGSVLAYSLILMSVMIMIAVGVSSVSIIGKKSASITSSSTQTLQTADSGIKLAIKTMETSIETDEIGDKFSCLNGDITMSTATTGLPGNITLNFFKLDGTTKVACNEPMSEIANIKSKSDFENTTRAVEVALAAGVDAVYQTICTTTTNVRLLCCRIKRSNGETECKNSSLGTTWNNIGSPWGASSPGLYSIDCGVNNNALYCCRSNSITGASSVCKQNDSLSTTWIDFGSASPW